MKYIVSESCRNCKYDDICKGECKGIINAYYGKLTNMDPGCFKDLL